MKKIALSLATVALMFTVVSCNKTQPVETKEEAPVAETPVAAVVYTADAANSKIEWKGAKLGGMDAHNGTIAIKSGELSVKDGMIESGSFVIDMNSISVLDITDPKKKEMLEGHLKGSDEKNADHFFNVAQFPEGKFEITAVKEGNIEGNLTLKGETKNISFPATVTVNDTEVSVVTETFTINRTEWNINYNNEESEIAKTAKDKVISNNIEIKLDIKAKK
ncbi:MAG: YceI family protein [Bacteroidota bacterium]|nr:YceI family protein [Bacteroidota bacterium]